MEAKKIIKLSVFFALFVSLAPISIKAAAPTAITDLYCVFSGTPGAIWLSWTVPAGSPTSYSVRYALSGITEEDFNNAYSYSQSWAGSAAQGLVEGLTQNKNWFFAIKAVNGDGTSAVSNGVSCQPNNPATSTALVTVPSSSIFNLQTGAEITAGTNYIVKGFSSDAGGSSIQKVELSLDNGVTWQKTIGIKQIGTGFEWQYNWTAPKIGNYLFKTRAVDWLGYQEDPAAAISVKVIEQQSSIGTVTTGTVSQIETQEQQRRNLLIQIIQILIQMLSTK